MWWVLFSQLIIKFEDYLVDDNSENSENNDIDDNIAKNARNSTCIVYYNKSDPI